MLAVMGPKPLPEPERPTARKSPPAEKRIKTDPYEKHVGGWLPVLWDPYDPPEVAETFCDLGDADDGPLKPTHTSIYIYIYI